MEFFVKVRCSENWDQLNSDNYHYRWWGCRDAPKTMAHNIRAWDYLSCDYFTYRCHLKRLAQDCHFLKSIGGDVTSLNLRLPSLQKHWRRCDKSQIVLPLDDDDYHYPSVVKHLEKAFQDPEVNIVSWDTWVLNLRGKVGLSEFHAKGRVVPSNSYAIRGGSINQSNFDNHLKVRSDLHLPIKLSLKIEHPASGYRVTRMLVKEELRNTCWREFSVPQDLKWATEVIDQLVDLTKSLRWQAISLL